MFLQTKESSLEQYIIKRTKGLDKEVFNEILIIFQAIDKALEDKEYNQFKYLFIDMLILHKQKEQIERQVRKLTCN